MIEYVATKPGFFGGGRINVGGKFFADEGFKASWAKPSSEVTDPEDQELNEVQKFLTQTAVEIKAKAKDLDDDTLRKARDAEQGSPGFRKSVVALLTDEIKNRETAAAEKLGEGKDGEDQEDELLS